MQPAPSACVALDNFWLAERPELTLKEMPLLVHTKDDSGASKCAVNITMWHSKRGETHETANLSGGKQAPAVKLGKWLSLASSSALYLPGSSQGVGLIFGLVVIVLCMSSVFSRINTS